MFKNRLFVLLIALALLMVAALTIDSGIATSAVVSRGNDLSDYFQRHHDSLNPADASLGTAPQSLPDPYMSPDNFIVVPNEQPAVGTTGADLSDYFQRHPESTIKIDVGASDWFQRHPEVNAANAADLSDYYQRHPGSSTSIDAGVSDWFQRHPEVNAANAVDLSDYFQRHPTVMTLSDTTGAIDYIQRHPDSLKPGNAVDLADWFLRHPELTTH